MPERAHLRVQYLRRLTDRTGLSRGGAGGDIGGLAGYDTLDNARGLRLTTRLNELGMHDDAASWAFVYLQFLFQALRDGKGFAAYREPLGEWSVETLGSFELAQAAQGLAAASASALPGVAVERADALWGRIVPDFKKIHCARTAASWLIAIAERPPAEQRKCEADADRLANWLIENCYYPIRSSEWEWFDEHVMPFDTCLPHGLWAAYSLLGESRYAQIAVTTTDFLVANLFDNDLFLGIGTRGGWPRHCSRARFDQLPSDAASMIELLCCAADVSGRRDYAALALAAKSWFNGNNIGGVAMLDDTTGGVFDALTPDGHGPCQSASSLVSYLLSAVALRRVHAVRAAANSPVIETT